MVEVEDPRRNCIFDKGAESRQHLMRGDTILTVARREIIISK